MFSGTFVCPAALRPQHFTFLVNNVSRTIAQVWPKPEDMSAVFISISKDDTLWEKYFGFVFLTLFFTLTISLNFFTEIGIFIVGIFV